MMVPSASQTTPDPAPWRLRTSTTLRWMSATTTARSLDRDEPPATLIPTLSKGERVSGCSTVAVIDRLLLALLGGDGELLGLAPAENLDRDALPNDVGGERG